MVDQIKSTAIRKPSKLSSALCLGIGGCLVGALIAGSGVYLAASQEKQVSRQITALQAERSQLLEALSEARLTAPRLRLEELASLPLLSEYLEIAKEQPDSLDARDLKDYLQTVLDAAGEETGFGRITLESSDGDELLVSESFAAGSEIAATPKLEAAVPGFDDPETTIGRIAGYLPENTLNILLPDSTNGTDVTASTPSETDGLANQLGAPNTTRIFAIIAGLATILLSLFGAVLLRKNQRSTSA
ncbi:hypothetical protein FIV00_14065 [Labrenzia sp. THAF82]|uniref:hypothetical protein n=1 Tax=Labrenzia sp. THAF82 TaxID=2587861 RepID=UPI00126875FA|nr:hypothetical protein [Labrenzia sp. THAF82]QFT31616.1 hypothetical protein FIV00_14065 [Labrenzia sp. THAF82]